MMDSIHWDHDRHFIWYVYSFNGTALVAIPLKSETRKNNYFLKKFMSLRQYKHDVSLFFIEENKEELY